MTSGMRIEISGAIGSGKTTLGEQIRDSFGFVLSSERFHQNPFWADFFKDPRANSFETELSFLLQHYHDIRNHSEDSMHLVCDYSLVLDRAYAEVVLNGRRRDLFQEIILELEQEIGLPSVVVHLSCPEEVLLQRIRCRQRQEEMSISVDYLCDLSIALKAQILRLPSSVTVVDINSQEIDFRNDLHHVQHLVETIRKFCPHMKNSLGGAV